jgi:hypothetical protein
MAEQNANAVAITGGTINGTTVGATTPAAGTFTTVTTPTVRTTGASQSFTNTTGEALRITDGASATSGYLNISNEIASATRTYANGAATNVGITWISKGTGAHNFASAGAAGTLQMAVSHTASAVNYVQVTGAATTGQPTISAQGSDTNIGLRLQTKGDSTVYAVTNSVVAFDAYAPASSVNWLRLRGNTTGIGGALEAFGSDANVDVILSAKGTGAVRSYTNGNQQFAVFNTASAVNYVQVTGGSTGNAPYFISQGSDTNVNLWYGTKGTGYHAFFTAGNGANVQFLIANTASAVNYVQTSGSTTGFGAKIFSAGSDTNIPLVLQPKGTGALQAQQTDSTATGGNARGANAVDWQTNRSAAGQVASGQYAVVAGGSRNQSSGDYSFTGGGFSNSNQAYMGVIAGGQSNTNQGTYSFVGGGQSNSAQGIYTVIGGGWTNTGTGQAAVTTQSATANATTTITLGASNASIKVGQYVTGTYISGQTYVAAISGTTLTLSQTASGSGATTLSFFTPHGVVVGGGNNTATGSYSFIGGGGDAGTAGNRNVASGDWSVVGGGRKNTASGSGSIVVGGGWDGSNIFANTASGNGALVVGGIGNTSSNVLSSVLGGQFNVASGSYSTVVASNSCTANGYASTVIGGEIGISRSIAGNIVLCASSQPISGQPAGAFQSAVLVLARQTTDATPTVLASNSSSATTTNQVIMPNNSAYFFTGEVIAGVTGGGNTKGWTIEGVIKRGANAASTALVGTPTVTSTYADAGASTWVIAVTADTTNGGLAVTFTGQASTTIRTVAKISTVEMTY